MKNIHCISRQVQQGTHFTTGVHNWTEDRNEKKQTQSRQIPTNTETLMKTSKGYCQIFARWPKVVKTKKWRIPVKNRVCHRHWHMIENRVTRYHICHFSAISLKNPGDFLLEINQQIFSTHPHTPGQELHTLPDSLQPASRCRIYFCYNMQICLQPPRRGLHWFRLTCGMIRNMIVFDDYPGWLMSTWSIWPVKRVGSIEEHAVLEHFIF